MLRAIATRAAHVDGTFWRANPYHPRPHCPDGSGDFLRRLVTLGHVGQERGDGGVGHIAIEHLAEQGFGF
jgi:hypothetical protein